MEIARERRAEHFALLFDAKWNSMQGPQEGPSSYRHFLSKNQLSSSIIIFFHPALHVHKGIEAVYTRREVVEQRLRSCFAPQAEWVHTIGTNFKGSRLACFKGPIDFEI